MEEGKNREKINRRYIRRYSAYILPTFKPFIPSMRLPL